MLFFFGDELACFQVYPNLIVNTHVDVRDPHEGEACKEITAPVVQVDLVIRDNKDEDGNVMAKAIFTGEKVEELSANCRWFFHRTLHTIFPGFPKHFFMGNSPGDTSDRYR
jgi:hypothetical protein